MDDIEFVANKVLHIEGKVQRMSKMKNHGLSSPHESAQLQRKQAGRVGLCDASSQIRGHLHICDGLFLSAVRVLHRDRALERHRPPRMPADQEQHAANQRE